uniref:Metalloendopeptidase n=1 Tax=Ascaris lumbricoides TaxID=6252 RepID=A0A0M3I553_ASCLU
MDVIAGGCVADQVMHTGMNLYWRNIFDYDPINPKKSDSALTMTNSDHSNVSRSDADKHLWRQRVVDGDCIRQGGKTVRQ